ncbi:dUTP diphosphatase [Beijerinckia indica]|uniref:Deoxyuridine 5'-triphosphate nucleotidohydrolase n=1 Tax=Beijerinckia indica subsp. indica (strain ATCC 9039 / DSM 1715 / NCIMB 8712) TaxID=395963 RepID=DUT_BEII9|nr:dUTP diphosphatase [Beijerinckia indica]B2IKJ9.1 RecName: Full=Deoxyuridine 5'-triphosphate nucleotidohydrolase; Short=dUTPase; AltName: Full=dUTP pyrophosphatase [Beijerinckia indica subsp. indica ATCC 9039]ACB96479.1 deoxyuridine 5'-triphosphate nucleotidohydrolase Dut [Beijerinckia indica subsp. indica ATCC 9039]
MTMPPPRPPRILVKRLAHAEGLALPAYQTAGAAGLDLAAALPHGTTLVLEPGGRHLLPTGFCLEIPEGYEAQVRPRSGLARKHGVTVLNTPGTIDADYRGEIGVILINMGDEPFEIVRGTRIAQLVVAPCVQAELIETHTLSDTERGEDGFGSTGHGSHQ